MIVLCGHPKQPRTVARATIRRRWDRPEDPSLEPGDSMRMFANLTTLAEEQSVKP